jgi:hypothetical protein
MPLARCRTGCPCKGAFHDRIERHPSRMIGGLAAGVSVAAVVSSDTLIGGGRAQSRKGRLFWFPAPSAGLGIGVTLQACSKSNVTRFIRLREIRTLSGAPHRRILKPNRNRPHREATLDWRDRQ